jgi:DNA-binding NtrC family response regulator
MPPWLLLQSGPAAGRRYEVVSEVTLGRSPSCEILLEDRLVSRRHARIFVRDGELRIADLGSRNGTEVNGERLEGEAVLAPGDQVQVGETTVLVEPPAEAAPPEVELTEEASLVPLEEVLPHVGPEAALGSMGLALLSATSEALVLRRIAEEALRALHADTALVLLAGGAGLVTAARVGASSVEVPGELARAALERSVGRAGTRVCAPLVASGGQPFGVLYLERSEPRFSAAEGRLVAVLGRLGGEACAAMRSRAGTSRPSVEMVGSSHPFRKVVDQTRRAAATSVPVLLCGEPGTGKRLCAHFLHAHSPRALGPLVTVDCREGAAAVGEQLFGRAGGPGGPPLSSALLRADGGALLLHHMEALPRTVAERLASLLARKVAPAPQGGEEPVDVRLLATASASLRALVIRGELEGSLSRLLSGAEVELPPLRDRRADVPALFEHFAALGARAIRKASPMLSPEAARLLGEYEWPHNVRELELLCARLALVHAGARVEASHLPPEIQEGSILAAPLTLNERLSRLERDTIAEALRAARGKKILAARLLGISRPTLDRKIAEYGFTAGRARRRE